MQINDKQYKDLMDAIDLVLLHYQGGKVFQVKSDPPFWFSLLSKVDLDQHIFTLDNLDPFIENFFIDASEFWQLESKKTKRSGYWSVEQNNTGDIHIFEAIATNLDHEPFIIIQHLGTENSFFGKSVQEIRQNRLKLGI